SLESLGESLKEHFESLNKENIDISLRIDEVR
ncbi:MAG: hypothetical protein ACI9MF_001808, partial [Gammaproteobacteria bacterium]